MPMPGELQLNAVIGLELERKPRLPCYRRELLQGPDVLPFFGDHRNASRSS